MASMPKIMVEVGPSGLGTIIIGADAPGDRSRALRFLATKMESLGRLDEDLRERPKRNGPKPYSTWTKVRIKGTGQVIEMAPLVAKAMIEGGTAEAI
jgi:hypothetical protein